MRLSLYVPDKLGERVKALNLSIAAICQPALKAAVEQREAALATDATAKGIARLRASRSEKSQQEANDGYGQGQEWALHSATYTELEFFDTGQLSGIRNLNDRDTPSLFRWGPFVERYTNGQGLSDASINLDDDLWFRGFVAGVTVIKMTVDDPTDPPLRLHATTPRPELREDPTSEA